MTMRTGKSFVTKRRRVNRLGAEQKGYFSEVPENLFTQLKDSVENTGNRHGQRVFRNVSEAVIEALTAFLRKKME
jgi:hypothetical protein